MRWCVKRRGTVAALGLLVACMAATVAFARPSSTRISLSGRIGALRINVSTSTQIIARLGTPDYSHRGNIGQGAPPTPNYDLLGYDCTPHRAYTTCAVNYFLNARKRRLESFSTSSSAFVLPGGVHVGMPAAEAVKIEHEPDIGGCTQQITVTTPQLTTYISTRGGHFVKGSSDVVGGRVIGITIDDRRYGVGAGICL